MTGKCLHVLPHFHYDVVFQKTYEDYLAVTFEVLKKALVMIDRVKGFTFGVEQTLVLEEFLHRYPNLRDKLTVAIRSGRMEITCGMYVMPDMNLPSGESMIRQILRGRRWLKREFGVEPRACMSTDCFGHHRQLPQILIQCGYEFFIFSRGMPTLGPTEFWWKGVDGSRILTHWNYRGYGSAFSWLLASQKNWSELKDSIADIARMSTTDQTLILLGGDFCPPIPHAPEVVKNISDSRSRATFSTLTGYMDMVRKTGTRLKTISKDLNPLMEGCYSTRIQLKQMNRELENEVGTLEKLCVLNGSSPQMNKSLQEIWKTILINQFHDTICGSIIDRADIWVRKLYQATNQKLKRQIPLQLNRLTDQIAGKGRRRVVSVFNPTCHTGPQVVVLNNRSATGMMDENHRQIPVQPTKSGAIFVDTLPSVGLKTYATVKSRFPSSLKITCDRLENRFYKLRIKCGVIASLVEKQSGREFVNPEFPVFNTLAIQKDQGDSWLLYESPVIGDTWKPQILPDPMPARMPIKEYFFTRTKHGFPCDRTDYQNNCIEIIERGPVRAGLKISGTLVLNDEVKVPYEQCIYLYDQLRRIDFTTRIFPAGRRYRIRACFPTLFKTPQIDHEIPFGVERRVPGEFPALNWVNYCENGCGLLVLNKGLPGNNFYKGTAMISLFRSTAMEPEKNSAGSFCEGREHFLEYAIIPYTTRTPIRPALEGIAYNTNVPAQSTNAGTLTEQSFLKIGPENVMLSGFYLDQDDPNRLIIRIYEAEGKPATGHLKFGYPLAAVTETNCLGDNIHKNLPITANEIRLNMKPFEIKTFVCRLKS